MKKIFLVAPATMTMSPAMTTSASAAGYWPDLAPALSSNKSVDIYQDCVVQNEKTSAYKCTPTF
ncbi:hypothetical protein ACFQ08_03885 [Streptosporangium algeriense]|uniref:Uncharacterized protein n=1 Tax=Streptosporangium algeriense TaxID=1682748 RepID=A0ABW3DK10_9ACTN